MTPTPPLDVAAAHVEERFFVPVREPRWARARFVAMVVLVLAVHVGVLVAFLTRKAATPDQPAPEATPVEVVQEQPQPAPPPPPPPPPQQPQKPSPADDRPAFSAPRAPDKTAVETKQSKDKTAALKTAAPPRDGKAAKSETEAPPEDKPAAPEPKEAGTLEDDKRDAEALDRAKITEKPAETAKAALPRMASAVTDAAGEDFAAPTLSAFPDGHEDEHYTAIVFGQIMSKNRYLGSAAEKRGEKGLVVIGFTVDFSGRVEYHSVLQSSGKPALDQIAMRAIEAAGPFPSPPGSGSMALRWIVNFGNKPEAAEGAAGHAAK